MTTLQFRIAQGLEIHELGEALEIGIARVDFFERLVVWFCRSALAEFCRARFDVARHFGKRRAAIGAGKFQALIFGGIVAGRKIDRAVDLAPQDFVGDGGRRRRAVALAARGCRARAKFPRLRA